MRYTDFMLQRQLSKTFLAIMLAIAGGSAMTGAENAEPRLKTGDALPLLEGSFLADRQEVSTAKARRRQNSKSTNGSHHVLRLRVLASWR